MKHIALLIVAAFCASCSTLPKQYAKSPTRSLVRGESTPNSNVLIRKVDDSDILWVRGYNLGNKVWLEPGTHEVFVMCVTNTSWGSVMGGTEVMVKVEPGAEYLIKAKPGKKTDKKPSAEVVKVSG